MKNLKKLIKDLEKQSKAKWAIKEDMTGMYKQDAIDTEVVLLAILGDRYKWAQKKLNEMDTLPRENAVMAIVEDKGNDWAYNNIGWSAK
mgnify:CR=1 FL=1